MESVLGKEEDGANAEVPAPRPIQIHDLSLKVKEKPSFFFGCVLFKGMGYFGANWNSHRVISVDNLLKLEVHQRQHQKWGIMFH